MARPRSGDSGKKKRSISVTVDPDLLEWVEERTGTGQRFASRSHAFERALYLLKQQEEDDGA